MKSIGITLLISLWSLGAVAQESRLFDYDREQVRSILETIDESTVGPCGNCFVAPFAGDTAQASPRKYFWTGAIGGTVGCIGGVGAGYLFGELMNMGTAVGWAGLITGAALGYVVPQMITAGKTKDPKDSRAALLGSTAALGIGIGSLLLLFAFGD